MVLFLSNLNFSAREWATLAGRDDLADKKLENLTKYYLCSDHFSDGAFVDASVEDKSFLRLNKAVSIPLPTIFEDNLMKNVKCVTENPEKFVNYTKHTTIETAETMNITNPLVVIRKQTQRQKDQDNANKPPVIEEYLEYIEEELEISRADQALESVDLNCLCRLCARNSDDLLVAIFDNFGNLNVETECLKLMPPGVILHGDGLPQYACTDCIDKLQSCVNIINGFVLNQSLFLSE